MAEQLRNQSLSIFQIHEVQKSHSRVLAYLIPEFNMVKKQLAKDTKLLKLIPQKIQQLTIEIMANSDRLNSMNKTELQLVQKVVTVKTRIHILSARQQLLNNTIGSVQEEEKVIIRTQRLDENKISKNTKRIYRNLKMIHTNSKRISKVNKRLNQEIKDRIQRDKDTLEKAKKYTDQQVKNSAKEPWYNQIIDFFKNLPKELKELIKWLKKLIPVIVGLFCIILVIYLVKTFGFNPCRPCLNYSYKRQAQNEAKAEAKRRGITLKALDEERLKIDMREAYKRGDMKSGQFFNYYHDQISQSTAETIPINLINAVTPTANVGLLSHQQILAAAQIPTTTKVKIGFFILLLSALIIIHCFTWVWLISTHLWLAISLSVVLSICTIVQLRFIIMTLQNAFVKSEETVV